MLHATGHSWIPSGFGFLRPAAARSGPRRLRTLVAAVGAITLSVAGIPALTSPAGAAGTLTDCTDGTLRAAVAAGGAVQFGVDCTNLVLSSSITIPSGLIVSIEANGHDVQISGGDATRHFVVDGGSLTLVGVTLRNGRMTAGSVATGLPGTTGADGDFGTGGGQLACIPLIRPVADGEPGSPGTDGLDGTSGGPGADGAAARGGSVLVNAGSLVLDGARIRDSQVVGGPGGRGGAGGDGGEGGAGGPGGPGGNDTPPLCSGAGKGGAGAAGGSGGSGGPGGAPGAGGAGLGGAVFNAGTLTLRNASSVSGAATGGPGGVGGAGGAGGASGAGGAGGGGGAGYDGSPGGAGAVRWGCRCDRRPRRREWRNRSRRSRVGRRDLQHGLVGRPGLDGDGVRNRRPGRIR